MGIHDIIQQYTEGECHVFAVALSRLLPGAQLFIVHSSEIYDETDDSEINGIIHVFAAHEDKLIDVRGIIEMNQLTSYILDHFREMYGYTSYCSEANLNDYCGYKDGLDRPLYEFTQQDVIEATEIILTNPELYGIPTKTFTF